MLVENTTLHIIGIGHAERATLTLVPGVNVVDADHWSAVKDGAKEHIDDGDIVEYPDDADSPGKMPIPKARDLVMKTFDVALLKSWLADEKRAQVKADIEYQLAEIEKRGDKDAKPPLLSPAEIPEERAKRRR